MSADLWQRGCERLASELPEQQFNTWIRPLALSCVVLPVSSSRCTRSIGTRTGTRKYVYIVEDPASFTTGAFRNALIARGVRVDGTIRLGKAPPAAVKVASLLSPPLASMIAAMNREIGAMLV